MNVLKNKVTGLYFLENKGFTAATPAEATQFAYNEDIEDVQSCAKALGIGETTIEAVAVAANGAAADPGIKQNADGSSFAVSFVRPKDISGDGTVKAHRLNPSKRRFATEGEAKFHGTRFVGLEKHLGFYVTKTTDPVNAYVNLVTGKTNPVIGRGRTNR